MSSDLNYEYAKAYQRYLLKQAEQSRLAHLAQPNRKQHRRPFRGLLPKAWHFVLAWPTKFIQQFRDGSQPSEGLQCCDPICEACS
jgi:hypothetical protein